eukprot:30957-Pelagococcus_subviridis.AAC.40
MHAVVTRTLGDYLMVCTRGIPLRSRGNQHAVVRSQSRGISKKQTRGDRRARERRSHLHEVEAQGDEGRVSYPRLVFSTLRRKDDTRQFVERGRERERDREDRSSRPGCYRRGDECVLVPRETHHLCGGARVTSTLRGFHSPPVTGSRETAIKIITTAMDGVVRVCLKTRDRDWPNSATTTSGFGVRTALRDCNFLECSLARRRVRRPRRDVFARARSPRVGDKLGARVSFIRVDGIVVIQ